jgi:hypothetical protein
MAVGYLFRKAVLDRRVDIARDLYNTVQLGQVLRVALVRLNMLC